MTSVDPILVKTHQYITHCDDVGHNNTPYFDMDGALASPFFYGKSATAIKNGLALATLQKMKNHLPALIYSFTNLREVANYDQFRSALLTLRKISDGVQDKVSNRAFNLCDYLYAARVRSNQRDLAEAVIMAPLARFEYIIDEKLPSGGLASAARLVTEIESVNFIENLDLATPEQFSLFVKEQRFLVLRVYAFIRLKRAEMHLSKRHEWSTSLANINVVRADADLMLQQSHNNVLEMKGLLLKKVVLVAGYRLLQLKSACEEEAEKFTGGFFTRHYRSIVSIFDGGNPAPAIPLVPVKNT